MNGKKLNGILIEEKNVDTRKDRILRLCIDLCIAIILVPIHDWL